MEDILEKYNNQPASGETMPKMHESMMNTVPPVSSMPKMPAPKKHNGIKGILMFLLGAVLFGAAAFAYQELLVVRPLRNELTTSMAMQQTADAEKQALTAELAEATKEIEQLTCLGVWDDTTGCIDVMVKSNFGEALITAANDGAIGIPIEGYDADLLLGRFSGLKKMDFHNVKALQGVYLYDTAEDTLQFIKNDEPEHSAARTISEEGMDMLHANLLIRYPNNTIGELIDSISHGDSMEIDESSDEDGDGLTYAEELEYGTDPKLSDTDGDGFSDGAEVANGYNPLGEGSL